MDRLPVCLPSLVGHFSRVTPSYLIHHFQVRHCQRLTIDYDTIRYNTRCYINVRSKANMSQLNLPLATDS